MSVIESRSLGRQELILTRERFQLVYPTCNSTSSFSLRHQHISSTVPKHDLATDMSVIKPRIGVLWYSMHGHCKTLAAAVAKGATAAGADVKQYQFRETLPDALVKKLGGSISINPEFDIATPQVLEELDGFVIGAPTRYGRLPAQVSAFIDSTGAQFASGSLVGKFVTTFTSSNTQHGGQETTNLTTMPFFSHMGIIHVPIGFVDPYTADLSEAHGGSPYGASTLAGADGKRTPTKGELELAEFQGKYFSTVVGTYIKGKNQT